MAFRESRKKGLSPLDFVILIIGLALVLGLASMVLRPYIRSSKERQSMNTVLEAREAVLRFAGAQKRLPTPAEFPTITRNIDAWGGTLFYYADPRLSSGESVCCAPGNGFEISEKGTARGGFAFLILSEGKDRVNTTGTKPAFTIVSAAKGHDDLAAYGDLAELRGRLDCPVPKFLTDSLPPATEDASYSFSIEISSSCPEGAGMLPAWSVLSGSLPPGLMLESNGTFTGSPDVSSKPKGTMDACSVEHQVTVRAQFAGGLSADRQYTLQVVPRKLAILPKDLPPAFAGISYGVQLQGAGGRKTRSWKVSSGTLPHGLALDGETGELTGTLHEDGAGTYSFTASLSDGCNSASRTFSISALRCPPLRAAPEPPIAATAGIPLRGVIAISGGTPPYVSIIDRCINDCAAFGLGLQCTAREAILSGTPLRAGTCSFSAEWQDSCAAGPQSMPVTYPVTISGAAGQAAPLPPDSAPRQQGPQRN